MASQSLPPNVHVSRHPCVYAKMSKFRSKQTSSRETTSLTHELALLIGCEAFFSLPTSHKGQDESPLGYTFQTTEMATRISVVPIMRSGLAMLDAINTLLPEPAPTHHLGLFREPTTLQPVEYYNNLPYHSEQPDPSVEHIAIIIDPIIATGGTAIAAIQTLREWGVTKIIMLSILGALEGVRKAAQEWDKVEIWLGQVDDTLDSNGMIKPGCGDVGDRLFGTKGR